MLSVFKFSRFQHLEQNVFENDVLKSNRTKLSSDGKTQVVSPSFYKKLKSLFKLKTSSTKPTAIDGNKRLDSAVPKISISHEPESISCAPPKRTFSFRRLAQTVRLKGPLKSAKPIVSKKSSGSLARKPNDTNAVGGGKLIQRRKRYGPDIAVQPHRTSGVSLQTKNRNTSLFVLQAIKHYLNGTTPGWIVSHYKLLNSRSQGFQAPRPLIKAPPMPIMDNCEESDSTSSEDIWDDPDFVSLDRGSLISELSLESYERESSPCEYDGCLSDLLAHISERITPFKGLGVLELKARAAEFCRHTRSRQVLGINQVRFKNEHSLCTKVYFDGEDSANTIPRIGLKNRRNKGIVFPKGRRLALIYSAEDDIDQTHINVSYPELLEKVETLASNSRFPVFPTKNYQDRVKAVILQFKEVYELLGRCMSDPVVIDFLDYLQKFLTVGDEISSAWCLGCGMAQELECIEADTKNGSSIEAHKKQLFRLGEKFPRLDSTERSLRKKLDYLVRDNECKLSVLKSDVGRILAFSKSINKAFDSFVGRHCRFMRLDELQKLSNYLGKASFDKSISFLDDLEFSNVEILIQNCFQQLEQNYQKQDELNLLLKEGFVNVCKRL